MRAFNVLVLVAPILGGLAGLAFIRLLGFKRFTGGELLLGLVAFVISLIVQQPLQQLPLLLELLPAILNNPANVQSIIREFVRGLDPVSLATFALWLGFVAGLVQSLFKYLFAGKRGYRDALNVGLGFGVAEAFFVGIVGSIQVALFAAPTSQSLYVYALSALERFLVTLFHAGSTLLLADMVKRGKGYLGFALVAAVHGSIDTLASLTQLMEGEMLLVATEVATASTGLILVLGFYGKAVREPEKDVLW